MRSGKPRRALVLAGVVLALAVALYLVLGGSDQEAVLSALREIGAGVSSRSGESQREHAARLRSVLARRAVPRVTLSVPELGTLEGSDEILELLSSAEGMALAVSIDQADVRIDTTRAQATLLVTFTVRVPGEERRQVRTVSADLLRRDGEFKVNTLALSAISREQPEARP